VKDIKTLQPKSWREVILDGAFKEGGFCPLTKLSAPFLDFGGLTSIKSVGGGEEYGVIPNNFLSHASGKKEARVHYRHHIRGRRGVLQKTRYHSREGRNAGADVKTLGLQNKIEVQLFSEKSWNAWFPSRSGGKNRESGKSSLGYD